MISLISPLIQAILPFLVPVCFLCTWGAIAFTVISVARTLRNGVKTITYLHSIPCSSCQFFTNDHHLKCTVHPEIANSTAAITCPDFCPRKSIFWQ